MAKKKPKQYILEYNEITTRIYPLIEESLKKSSSISNLKSCIERFIHKRNASLYDYAPVDRIFFRKADSDDFFRSINVNQKEISSILPSLYYWKDDELQASKDEFSLSCLMCLRYLLIEKPKEASLIELVAVYLAFSGKFYASCHYKFWEFAPVREVMDYVVNFMLSQKFDLVRTKSVFGAVRSLTVTWLNTYKEELSAPITDERIVYIIHQLYNRILAFLRNIAKLYYEAYEKKLYLNAESDNYSQDDYRIANNNSTIITSITERTMMYFSNSQINIAICHSVSGSGVDPYDIKAIFENILNDNNRLSDLRFVIGVLLSDFLKNYPNEKDITGPKFIAHSISMKPNTKDKNIIRTKNIILEWLNTSTRYQNIKTQATKNNYYKAILSYIAITINFANKEK